MRLERNPFERPFREACAHLAGPRPGTSAAIERAIVVRREHLLANRSWREMPELLVSQAEFAHVVLDFGDDPTLLGMKLRVIA